MEMIHSRRGSALLIVLGMLAFMVISSVAFSAYMRYSRLPSSYLRQTSASRLLVKAALAQAIDEIDAAIGNNPHPGVGTRSYNFPRKHGEMAGAAVQANRNKWIGRVYIGCTNSSQSSWSPSRCMVDQNETVSPLCLEALAYIPPPLVNEARYYSRRSQAAKWHSFNYDAGRYAFCAIDVSDYFDVNVVHADIARSSMPGSQLSLAYLFENDDHTSTSGSMGTPQAWDTFMEPFRDDELPLVSMADWNLVVNDQRPAGWTSPFCQYVENNYGNFYNGIATEGQDAERIRRMVFVTDSLMPNTNQTNQAGDLMNNQPFQNIAAGDNDNSQPSVRDIIAGTSPTRKLLEQNMTMLDIVSLYDYLDKNDVPASLALPTVERVPMFVGMQPSFEFTITPEVTDNRSELSDADWQVDEAAGTRKRPVKYKYRLKIQPGNCGVAGLWMFPFLREKEANGGSYETEFAVRLGFAVAGASGRVSNGNRKCGFTVFDDNDFKADGTLEGGVFRMRADGPSISTSQDVKSEDDAFTTRMVNLGQSAQKVKNLADGDSALAFQMGRWQTQRKDKETGQWIDDPEDQWPINENDVVAGDQFYPLKSDLNSHAYGSAAGFKEQLLNSSANIEVVPYLTIATRVKKDSKTYDLVPAHTSDDKVYNAINQDANIGALNGGASQYPLMLFTDVNNNKITFGEQGFKSVSSALTVKFQPSTSKTTVFCPDPRWNFAPENFLMTSDSPETLKANYKSNKSQVYVGVDGRDGDIFMSVSNQKWMQSPSELAFLPRTSVDLGGGDATFGNARSYLTARMGQGFADSFDDVANGKLMWRTYRLYDMGTGYDRDDIYDIGLYVPDSSFKISPYTDCTNVFMAAFANTPYSWWAAGIGNEDCENDDVSDSADKVNTFNQKYAFNGINGDAKFDWEDLKRVGGRIMAEMRDSSNWQLAFDNMDWAGLNSDLCGINFEGDTDDLYEVDRKMLFGFWRDCFAAKQQLFLIFVRAEPMMMGGGSANQTPPQLGAKAVALVWRDPKATQQNDQAHKTRVLFYRQFD